MKASENNFPKLLMAVQSSAVATPGTDIFAVYAKADGLHYVDSSGVDHGIGGGDGSGLGWFDVTAYGAVGDGTHDDTTAVQAAIDAAAAAIGSGVAASATVYSPAGVYYIDPVYCTTSNMRFLGEGIASVWKRRAATVTNTDSIGVLNNHGTSSARLSGIRVENMLFDGNKANITFGGGADPLDTECLSSQYLDFGRISGCWAINSSAEGFDFDYCADCVVEDCVGKDCDGNAIHFSNGCVRMRGMGCLADGCGVATTRGGFDVYTGTTYSSYENCHARACYVGFRVSGEFASLVGCTASACQTNGIRIETDHTTIAGCRVHGTTAGNAVTVTGSYNTLNGGIFYGSSGGGITVLAGANRNVLNGLVCQGNGGYGIDVRGTKNISTACQLYGNTSGSYTDTGTGNVSANNVTT